MELAGWDVLKEVQKKVESIFSSWFLDQLSLCWGAFLEGEDGLLKRWSIPDLPQDKQHIPNQQHFYATQLKPILDANPKNKVYVIISDALRHEIAEELKRTINSTFRFKARLDTQLGVLPSYTALGMAALLPHQEYGFKDGSDQIVVDGQPCASQEQRNAILSRYEGTAMRAEDLLSLMADAAFQQAMRKVLNKAKLANSPIVIWEDGQVKEIAPVVMESRLQEQKQRDRS